MKIYIEYVTSIGSNVLIGTVLGTGVKIISNRIYRRNSHKWVFKNRRRYKIVRFLKNSGIFLGVATSLGYIVFRHTNKKIIYRLIVGSLPQVQIFQKKLVATLDPPNNYQELMILILSKELTDDVKLKMIEIFFENKKLQRFMIIYILYSACFLYFYFHGSDIYLDWNDAPFFKKLIRLNNMKSFI